MSDDPEETAGEQRREDEDDLETERDGRGRFTPGNPFRFSPGVSGNPSGRPLGPKRALARVMRRIRDLSPGLPDYESAGEMALETLILEMRRKDGRQKVAAAKEVLDRDFGRVPVTIRPETGEDAESLTDLRIRLVTRDEVQDLKRKSLKLGPGGNGDGGTLG